MGGDINQKLLAEAKKNEDGEVKFKEKLWTESKKLWIVAGPAIFTKFSTFGITIISQAFVGHIGPTELAAFSLCCTVLLRFGNGVLVCKSFRLTLQWNELLGEALRLVLNVQNFCLHRLVWLVHLKHCVDKHWEQNNTICWGYTFKDHGYFCF